MGNALAIATVTATLRNLLGQVTAELPDTSITTKPPHKARSGYETGNQLNLFLYQTALNAAWHQKDRVRVAMGNEEHPPLALNLYYFITAYGRNDDDLFSHRLLGQAMQILHDRAVLDKGALEAALPGTTLHRQVEQIRVTPHPLSAEELSKLWSLFQTPYSISVAYQVSAVTIESARSPAPAPVSRQVASQQPLDTRASRSTCPIALDLQVPDRRLGARPGDILILRGHHLDGDKVAVHFQSARYPEVTAVAARLEGNATVLKVQLPATPHRRPTGMQALAPSSLPLPKWASPSTGAIPSPLPSPPTFSPSRCIHRPRRAIAMWS